MTPKRIQQRRTKGWRKPDGVVAVGRGTRWGNPAQITKTDTGRHIVTVNDANGVIYDGPDRHEAGRAAVDFYRRMSEHDRASIRMELAGRDLMCWCPLEDSKGNRVPCHADVLLEIANA